jgi:hypothetical protein
MSIDTNSASRMHHRRIPPESNNGESQGKGSQRKGSLKSGAVVERLNWRMLAPPADARSRLRLKSVGQEKVGARIPQKLYPAPTESRIGKNKEK